MGAWAEPPSTSLAEQQPKLWQPRFESCWAAVTPPLVPTQRDQIPAGQQQDQAGTTWIHVGSTERTMTTTMTMLVMSTTATTTTTTTTPCRA